jgi:hypothetical protein
VGLASAKAFHNRFQWVVVRVAFPFAPAGEDAGGDLQCGFVVVSEVDLSEIASGKSSFEGGIGDAFGGEQASVQ